MKLLIENRGANKNQAARRHYWTTVIVAAGVLHSLRREHGNFPEWNLPADFALIQIDGIERSPRRLDGRVAVRIQEHASFTRELDGPKITQYVRSLLWSLNVRNALVTVHSGKQVAHFDYEI